MKKLIPKLAALLLALTPSAALAQTTCIGNAVNCGLQNSGSNGLSFGSLFGAFSGGLTSETTLSGLIFAVIQLMLILSGMIAVVFVIIGGYQYITSGGNEEQAEKGKKAIINAIIGLVVVMLAYAIVTIIADTLTNSKYSTTSYIARFKS